MHRFSLLVTVLSCLAFCSGAIAETIRVAVASNFYATALVLKEKFEAQSNHQVDVISGSSGQLAAQIIQGAPFDLFFSADVQRAVALETAGIGQPNSRRTYALGKLVLVSTDADPLNLLQTKSFNYLAIANPDLAPYGLAAQQVLAHLGFDIETQKTVYANNVSQAYHYLQTGNAELAMVSLAQVMAEDVPVDHFALMPQGSYAPIEQQMLLISDKLAAQAFYDFLLSKDTAALIRQRGYDVPPLNDLD